jgi:hypothetical protein
MATPNSEPKTPRQEETIQMTMTPADSDHVLARLQRIETAYEHLWWITLTVAIALVMAIVVIGMLGWQRNQDGFPSLTTGKTATISEARTPVYSATLARVTGTPEQVVFEFGLNAKPWAGDPREFTFSHAVLMDFYTAKDLFTALERTIQMHEARFGTIQRTQ